MKKVKYLLIAIILSLFIINNPKATSYNNDYIIDEYNIKIDVNEDNTFDIIEEINAYFNVEKHGIIRKIPYINYVEREDGIKTKNYAKITGIKANEESSLSKYDGNYELKLGNENKTITGSKTYIIKYTYNLGKDPLKDIDEFYFNIIGSDWDTSITRVNFEISMPKEFDTSKIGFSSGYKGSTSNNVFYTVENNTIFGYTTTSLNSNEALTIRIELPEGYFSEAKSLIDNHIIIGFLIPIISLTIVVIIWYVTTKKNKVIDTVEFYPPEGYNSLDIAFLYKGKVDNKDIVSLLIYLADKGYLKIEQKNSNSLLSANDSTVITKIKEYDGNNSMELEFMNGLFESGNTVTVSSMKYNFYDTIHVIFKNMNSKENKKKIIKPLNTAIKIIIFAIVYLTFLLPIIMHIYNDVNIGLILTIVFLMAFYTPFFVTAIKVDKLFWKTFIFIFLLIHSGAFFYGVIGLYVYSWTLLLINLVITLICISIIIKISSKIVLRTKEGNEIYGRILGFRNFLITAEKEKLEHLVTENPTYFYDILPFTYVLDISDKWIKKFEDIAIEPVKWYSGSDVFAITTFVSTMNSTMDTISPKSNGFSSWGGSSSGGWSSSGGGSSGGGSGGGGGSSW